jgi:dihydrofolate synthase / folylpolyglutamate synthase
VGKRRKQLIVKAIKTHKITNQDTDLFKILDSYLPKKIKDGSILAITSKIISIIQGRMVETSKITKDELIKKESQLYLTKEKNKYHVSLTITQDILMASAGIDESNGNGYYILWPENIQQTTNLIRKYLKERFKFKKIGVIITDSKTVPFRIGVTGIALSHSGFVALKDLIGDVDLFGKEVKYTKINFADELATAAVFVMGETSEQTPLALIEDIPSVEFVNRDPTANEINGLKTQIENDLYASSLFKKVEWEKGEKS